MKRSQRGFGILEIMISMGLLGVGVYFVINGFSIITDSKKDVDESLALDTMVTNLIESIRINVAMEKIDFQPDEFLRPTRLEDVNALLKSCWGRAGIYTPAPQDKCKGRVGYVVTPYKVGGMTLLGLYRVTVRVTHETALEGRFKQFEFIVRGP